MIELNNKEDVTIYELPNEEDYGEKVNYELYELSNNESYILSNEKVDYKLPIEEVDDKISNDCEMSNEIQKEELFEEEPFNKESFEELFDNNEYFSEDELSDDYEEFNFNIKDGLCSDNDDDNEVQSKEISDKIVDKALNSEQMPHTDGEFAPYFKNVTEALMFCWIQKHNISTRAYDELVDIINHPKFKSEDVVTNFASTPDQITQSSYFKQKNPSTSKEIKDIYYLSITDIIWHSLNNPSLFGQMYFGPGKIVEKNIELWHGDLLWKESPRFGCAFTQINGKIYNCGDFVVYKETVSKIGRILAIVEMHGELKIIIQRVLRMSGLQASRYATDMFYERS
ncbi:hypothetical protein RhiirA5_383543 [Rhizophagus irregularis]|uniref:Uncharacterized protein n=1 Tax=Rhizophagus irregularis TaxID=588596 RepID=A0A2I1F6A7_9GLOM|nr:hypothetical protein RhiirA5_383543 [Rhizophagus irregularis]PKY29907.1 hypothetical protein RhiirB3_484931 [Rhizophagus irregularis]